MSTPGTEAKVADASQATTTPNRKITKVIVDPGTESAFVMDIQSAQAAQVRAEPNTRNARPEDRDRLAASLRATAAIGPDTPAVRVGTAVTTIDGGVHTHPAAHLPNHPVAPPGRRVHFDIPGYAAMSHRYHAVKRVPGFLVLITDTRFSGTADFYPYASRLAGEQGKPMGAYVDQGKKLYLLQPKSVIFRHDPFEFCLVPVVEEKDLPQELTNGQEVDLETETGVIPLFNTPTEGPSHGEVRSDLTGGDPAGGTGEGDDLVDRLDFRTGGKGGVL